MNYEFVSADIVISTHVAVTVEPEVGFLAIRADKNHISIHGEAFNADTIRTGSRKFKNIIFDIELTIVKAEFWKISIASPDPAPLEPVSEAEI